MNQNNFSIHTANQYINQTITLKGWVYNKRSSGSIAFLQLRDGSGYIQAVAVKNDLKPEIFEKCQKVTLESSVIVTGNLHEEKRAPGGYEITLTDLEIVSLSEEYPIGKKEHGPDFLLDYRHLWLRSKRQWAIQKVRNTIIYAIYDFFRNEGFIKIDAPILTPNACEGTTTLFPVPYLPAWSDENVDKEKISANLKKNAIDKPYVYLSQSGQLYIEAAIFSFGKVFDFGPTFRAEKSKTRRHLMEFWMMDAEAAFVEHRENIKIQEKLIKVVVSAVLEKCSAEMQILERKIEVLKPVISKNYPVITHEEAIKILRKKGVEIGDREDFGADAETILANEFDTPFFIEKYPKEVKAFYMKEDTKDKSRVLNADMLAPEGYGEIIGGSQREDSYEKLLGRIKELGLSIEEFGWYLELRKYGSVPHSGFGLGLERLVAWICKLDHVRETIPFPRMMQRFKP